MIIGILIVILFCNYRCFHHLSKPNDIVALWICIISLLNEALIRLYYDNQFAFNQKVMEPYYALSKIW